MFIATARAPYPSSLGAKLEHCAPPEREHPTSAIAINIWPLTEPGKTLHSTVRQDFSSTVLGSCSRVYSHPSLMVNSDLEKYGRPCGCGLRHFDRDGWKRAVFDDLGSHNVRFELGAKVVELFFLIGHQLVF
jgi:hypothetical protein